MLETPKAAMHRRPFVLAMRRNSWQMNNGQSAGTIRSASTTAGISGRMRSDLHA